MKKLLLSILFILLVHTTFSQLVMNNSGVTTMVCGGNFQDPGGGANYPNGISYTMTICSANAGECLYLQFLNFNVESGYDFMYVYDGPTNGSPQVPGSPFTGTTSPGTLTSTTGCLTITFTSDAIINAPGWLANVICLPCGSPPPPPPGPVVASDCNQAVNVCTDLGFSIDPNGYGAVDEVPPIGTVGNPLNNNPGGSGNMGCLQSGENNSTWMIVNISGTGNLEFSFGAGGAQAGYYDWAMWPYTATTCASIPGGNYAPVRCNWNAVSTGGTGLASVLPAGGDPGNYEPPLAVTCGQQYIICFSNYSSVSTTVPLQFGGTATVSCSTFLPITATNTTICPGDNGTITASGGTTYSWAPGGQTTPSITVSPATTTTYTVTGTGPCGSGTATATVTVLAPGDPACSCTAVTANGGPYCVGGTMNLTCNPVAGATSYSWSGPNGFSSGLQNPSLGSLPAAAAGVYTVTVTTPTSSCTATTTVVVNPLPTPTANNTGPYCAGATIQLNSPTGSATDDWAGPGGYTANNTQNPTRPGATVAMSGVYTVTVTNAAGCSATATTTVTVNPLPTPTATNTGPYCAGATIQLNSPTGSATDDWTGPGGYAVNNVQNPTILSSTPAMSGVYTVTVTNAAGCSATATTTVTVNALPVPTANNTGPYCVGATIQLNSPTGSATDDWTGPGGYTANNTQNPTRPSATLAMSGVYTVTVTNAAGCSATATTTVTVNPLPTPTANNTGPYCAGATIQLNSPTGSATDDWTGPSAYAANNVQNPTIGAATVAMSGVYTVTVTDAAGCSATATTTVTVNPLPTPTANNTGPYCEGATIQLNSPTGSATDDWTGPSAYAANNIQNPTIASSTLAMSGVYTVTVTNAAGCSATATTTVVVNPLPVPTANNTGPYCTGSTIQLNSPTGSATDDWTGPGGYVANSVQNPTIPGSTPAMSGVYTVTVTNAAGCSATATTTVTVNAAAVAVANNTGPYCAGVTINLTSAAGAIDYDWTGPGGYVQNNTQNPTIPGATVGMSGLYTVTITLAGGCTGTTTTNVVVNPLPTPTANNTGPYCAGATIQLNSPTGSATDDWAGPGGYVANDVQNPTIGSATVAMSGVYTVTVTTAAGCSATATTTVTVNALPTPTANNTGPYCEGATIQLNSPAGSATDDWTGPGAYVSNNTQNPTLPSSTVGMSGIYTVTVTNAAGCSATATTTVIVNPLPTPTANNTGPYCAGTTIQLNSPTGSATDDWAGPAAYAANNIQNPTIPSSTVAMTGLYTVTVTNGFGCSATATTNVVVNALPTPTANNTGPYCTGATIQLNSPTGSATDDWAGPGGYVANDVQNPTIPVSTPAMSGVYTVTVTNAAGCSATATTTVTVNANASPTANNTGPYCVGANINLSSGAGGLNYDWTGPGGYVQNATQNPVIAGATVAMSGTYTVTMTIAGGCTGTATTNVVVNPLPTPTANNTGPYCAGTTIQLNSPTGSATDDWTGPSAYAQNNQQNPTIPLATVAMTGVYTVTVTDGNGCSATATTNVTVNALPTPTANNTGPYCAGATIQLNSPTGSGTDDWTGPSAYSANNIQNPTIAISTVAMSGIYTVLVTDINGCTATATTNVVVNALPTPTANNTGPYCVGGTIQLNSPTGSATDDWTGPSAYAQNNIQNPTIGSATVAMSGIYTVSVTDGNGCNATTTTNVVVNPLPTPTANNTGPYCSGSTIQLNSPTGSATDDWTGPLGYTQNNQQNPTIPLSTVGMTGIYTVTVTDINGCSATATTNVVVNGPPTPTANNTGPYCVGATIQLNSPTGSGTDDWVGPSAYSANDIQNPTILGATVAMGGIYTVTVTDINGCFATTTTNVIVNPLPTPTANNTGPYCVGATIQLNSPTGSATDDWTGPSAYSANNIQNPTIGSSTVAMSGIYTVSVTDGNGCNATATTNVVINALPTPLANNTGPYCDGGTMDLSSAGGVDYDWSGPGGFALANTQNGSIPNVNPTMSGTYTVTVTDANGCVATANTIVTINGLPNAVANNNTPICEFQTINFTSGGGTTYDWTGPGGYNQPGIQNPSIVNAPLSSAGVYTVTVTDANGCISTATTTAIVNTNLVFAAGSNSPICEGTVLNLTADNIVGATYDWNGPNGFTALNQQNPTIANATVPASGTYTVFATNGFGCTGTATVNVLVNPLPTALFVGDNLSGCSPICVNFTDQSLGNGATINSWSWNVEGQTVSTNQNEMYCFANPGVYDAALTVTTTDGCSSTLSLLNYITVYSNPIASFIYTPQEIDESDPEVTFASTSTGATSWAWTFGDGDSSILENPIHSFADTGTFCILLTVANNFGCIDTATGCLYVEPVFSLFIPNAFTVNEDGLNETFNVYGHGIKTITVRIFDRWGEEIFFFDTLDKGWPGTRQNGQPCKQDVYVYRIEVVDGKNDFHEFLGRVTLIR